MRAFGRDLIRGGHYGQRSCEPRQQAEHMAAPTNAAKREESPCQPGAVHTWHETDLPRCPQFGSYRGESGHGGYERRLPSLTPTETLAVHCATVLKPVSALSEYSF